jgi:hypothetical protein
MFANVDQTIPQHMKTFLWFWSIGSGYDDVTSKNKSNTQGVQPKQGGMERNVSKQQHDQGDNQSEDNGNN